MRLFAFLGVLSLLAQPRATDEPRFSSPPAVKADAGGVQIRFAASRATDCAVFVLDEQGRVVRHLAAGLLGPNAPAPLRKNSLDQTMVWDRKDDLGRPVSGGPFKVRVCLSLKPTFEKFIGSNPASIGSVRALATNPSGEVFVFHSFGTLHPNDNSLMCSVFRRDGKYLRTILPYPAHLPDAKLSGLKRIELENGAKVPFLYHAENRSLFPSAGDLQEHRAVATKDGRVAFVGISETPMRYAQQGPVHLVVLHADGSVPGDGMRRTRIADQGVSATLALSPDEKTIYASDMRTHKGHYGVPNHTVYRFGWDDKQASVFLGPDKGLRDPKGLAVGKDGNVYVADKGNNRVALFGPNGSLVGELKVDRPERVEVHPATGAIYVLGGARINELQKFASWKDAAPVAKATLPTFSHEGYRVSMALEAAAEPASLWFGSGKSSYAKYTLMRVEDKGGSFGEPVEVTRLQDNARPGAGDVTSLSINRDRNLLQIGTRIYDVKAEKWAGSVSERTVGSFGLDGNFYGQIYKSPDGRLVRYGPDLKPVPFPGGSADGLLEGPWGNFRLRGRGITADALGNVYSLAQTSPTGLQPNSLLMIGPDGKIRNKSLIDSSIRSLNSVRVDYQGNIYLALGLRPGSDRLPPGLKGKLPEDAKDPDALGGLNCYPLIYGSIAKFGPEGGAIRKGVGGISCNYAFGDLIDVKGAKWIFSGASNVPSWRQPGPDICLCESPRFDVDGFGRSFFPDAGRFRVGIVDTEGNELGWFGSYGNPDSEAPEIPLCYPQAVAAGDDFVYVGDRLNRRVVVVKLAYAAEASVPLP
jgi:hypothetical protein